HLFLRRFFARAPGPVADERDANSSRANAGGFNAGLTRTSPRLRESLTALGFGYGLNEKKEFPPN
ncbi:MAG: hypothetical protein ACKO9H_08225, partial [Planctomycetota bacterium]